MKRFGGAGWLALALVVAASLPVGAQTTLSSAPEGLQLKVAESAVDVSTPSAVALHMRIVNGSGAPVTVWPGVSSLVVMGNDGPGSRCDNPPNTSARLYAAARTLRPGDTYSETLTLNTDVCKGLLHARAVQVERVVFAKDDNQVSLRSQPVPVQNVHSDAEAIKAMLTKQAADWNRGDLSAFATGYKNSPDILFIGRKTSRGYDRMLAAYKQGYATREAMGTLTFADLEVQPLDANFATATGRFHLERTPAGGGNADGYFLLVLEKTADGWKIVRDDTTPLSSASPVR